MKKFFLNTFRFIGALLALIRGIMVLGMLFVGVMSAYLIYVTATETINQYNETLTWKNTAYEVPLNEIEPALVSNIVDTDVVDAAAAWENLEEYVENLDGNSIPDRDDAQALLDEAIRWQGIYDLKSDAITRLSLYLELEDAIAKAYSTLDIIRLDELSRTLYGLEMEKQTPAGQQYMERLKTVSSDFAEAEKLMTETIGSVGTIKNGTWTIPYTYTRSDLTEVLERMQNMQKFPAVRDMTNVLSDIADVLNYNKNARQYFEYQKFAESVAGLNRSQYVAVSSIYTYGQALAFGCSVQVSQVPGFTISLESPVTGIYYNGERLASNEYIRIGAPVIAEIDPTYEPIPVPETEAPVGEESEGNDEQRE